MGLRYLSNLTFYFLELFYTFGISITSQSGMKNSNIFIFLKKGNNNSEGNGRPLTYPQK